MSNLKGFIKIHRKLIEWGWYSDSVVKDLFIHLLIVANWSHTTFMGYSITPGQAIIGRKKLAKDLGFTEQQIRTGLKKLESTGEIILLPTNKFTIATVVNWEAYQEEQKKLVFDNPREGEQKSGKINQQINHQSHQLDTLKYVGGKDNPNQENNQSSNNPSTNHQPTDNQQVTTPKEYKNNKKVRNNIREAVASAPEFLRPTLNDFVEMRKVIKAPMTVKAVELLISKVDKLADGDINKAIAILEQSIANSWKGIFPLKDYKKNDENDIYSINL